MNEVCTEAGNAPHENSKNGKKRERIDEDA